MDRLPKDPMILFSTVNMNVDRNALETKLAAVGFEYSEKNNKFW